VAGDEDGFCVFACERRAGTVLGKLDSGGMFLVGETYGDVPAWNKNGVR
jgi:hypothetical protein